MSTTIRTRVFAILAALVSAFGVTAALAPAAQATTIGYVYISFPTWEGNCAGGDAGVVRTIWADDGYQSWNGDAGDDLIYGRVALNTWTTIRFSTYCYKWPAGNIQPGYTISFWATRNNQTIWVGPWGWTRN